MRGTSIFWGWGSLGTYLHCVIVNAVGRERLHDAHVAGKRDRDTHEGGYLAELEPLRVCAYDKTLKSEDLLENDPGPSPPPQDWSLQAELNSRDTCYVNTHKHNLTGTGTGHLLYNCLTSGLAIQFLVVFNYSILARIIRQTLCYIWSLDHWPAPC